MNSLYSIPQPRYYRCHWQPAFQGTCDIVLSYLSPSVASKRGQQQRMSGGRPSVGNHAFRESHGRSETTPPLYGGNHGNQAAGVAEREALLTTFHTFVARRVSHTPLLIWRGELSLCVQGWRGDFKGAQFPSLPLSTGAGEVCQQQPATY